MAIVNRSQDASEQRKDVYSNHGALATGVTAIVHLVASPCILDAAQMAIVGMSGAPTYQLSINRFIPGSGFTSIALGSANAGRDFGVSGVLSAGMSLPAAGSTLLNLMANDLIEVVTGGANSAAAMASIHLVIRPIQDIKQFFGLV